MSTNRVVRRLVSLYLGLIMFGGSVALMLRSGLGPDPWDVLHQGLSEHTGLRFGWVVIAVGAVVLLLWLPLKQRPGLGTVSNVVVVGLAADVALSILPHPHALLEVSVLAVGWLLGGSVGVGTVLYALSIGPLAHFFIPKFAIADPDAVADEIQRRVLTNA